MRREPIHDFRAARPVARKIPRWRERSERGGAKHHGQPDANLDLGETPHRQDGRAGLGAPAAHREEVQPAEEQQRGEQDDLGAEHHAIGGAIERGRLPDVIPREIKPAADERRDGDDRHHREASGGEAARRPLDALEHHQEIGNAADPDGDREHMRIFGEIERERMVRPAHRMGDGDLGGDEKRAANQQQAGRSVGLDEKRDEGRARRARSGGAHRIRADEVLERQIERAAQESDEPCAGYRFANRQRQRAPEHEATRRSPEGGIPGRGGEDEKGRAAERQRLRGEDPAAHHDVEIAVDFQE